jgi:hypothetical protein
MKKSTLFPQLFLTLVLLILSVDSFAARRPVNIRHFPIGESPRPRTELIICVADKEAGYVELNFRANLGEVQITMTDSNGNLVEETTLDTSIERMATLSITDQENDYVLKIMGDRYNGEGFID